MNETDTLTAALAGRYEVEREIGRGGMAVVYLARDLRHGRKVALKVLKPELAAVVGAERFLAEIETTANLQHPHILALFDSGQVDGTVFYVMPFVDGESLRQRLAREKQLPIDDAVRLAREVADALQYAHAHGVIHRDVKPENILLQGGHALVADFGIALAASKTGGLRMTETGMSLGTPTYMSPEQAMGDRSLDARTDIYALGCVLYEALVGDAPFTGPTAQAVVAKVLTEKAAAIIPRRDRVPPHVERAVLKAIEKLPADRWASAKDFAAALEDRDGLATTASRRFDGDARRPTGFSVLSGRQWAAAAGLALLVVGGAYAIGRLGAGPAGSGDAAARFVLNFEPNEHHVFAATGVPFAISPDGKLIVYAATRSSAAQRLYVRPIGDLRARELQGTDGAIQPAFSPDGRWIAFLEGNLLKKTPAEGGTPVTLATLSNPRGVAWGAHDQIVVGTFSGGLVTVPASGGVSRPLTTVTQAGISHRAPVMLGDGTTVAYWIRHMSGGGLQNDRIGIVALDGGEASTLSIVAAAVLGLIDGQLVYVTAAGALMAVPFDLATRRATGPPVQVDDEVFREPSSNVVLAALSTGGILIFQRGTSVSQLVLSSGRGDRRVVLPEARAYGFPRFSPDGRRIAVTVTSGGSQTIWIHDRTAGTFARLTDGDGPASSRPEWSRDGRRVLFYAAGSGLRWQPSDNSGPSEPLLKLDSLNSVEGVVSPDGQVVLFRVGGGSVTNDLWYARIADRARFTRFVTTPFYETAARFSPDGRWVAYSSDETGSREVYVTAFPGPGAHFQVSAGGGAEPVWSPDGRRLFYVHDRQLISTTVTLVPGFTVGARETLFEGDYVFNFVHANYDVSPDGKEFLLLKESGGAAPVVVVLNWLAELRARTRK